MVAMVAAAVVMVTAVVTVEAVAARAVMVGVPNEMSLT
tara:strand:+ start:142 stop:255 length:114 start_codon:yes stop_codon:yes gene_type:complete